MQQMSSSQVARLLCIDNPKAVKAQKYGWINAIHYMAPATLAGVGNMCPHATAGCKAICLGEYSGQAAMVKKGKRLNNVRRSRRDKARRFMRDRTAYMRALATSISKARKRAAGMPLCVRLNGSTDVAWEAVRFVAEGDAIAQSIIDMFPDVQFTEYTKNPLRLRRQLPPNLNLTFSRSETNEAECREALELGYNVAVVFSGMRPETYLGRPVIDGDAHDLRHLDPRGCIVGLSPKGARAKRDTSGFVVRM